MKTDVNTMKEIERLFQIYEDEIHQLEADGVIAANTSKTYLLHSGNFVRWCRDEFEPGVKKR